MSLIFNGSALLEYSGSPVTAFPVTLFCWVKPANITQVGGVIGIGEFGAGKEMAALQVSAAMRAQSRDGSASNNAVSSGVDTTYRPVMVVFSSAEIRKVYYGENAVVSDIGTNLPDISTLNRLRIGNRAFDALSPFSGEIAEAAIWSAALGATEWASLHGGAAPETVATGSLVDAWDLQTQAASHTGVNGRVLTATGTTQGGTHPISRGATTHEITISNSVQTNTVSDVAIDNAVAGTHNITISSAQQVNTVSTVAIQQTVPGSGTITTPEVREWETRNLKTGLTGVQVDVRSIETGALLVRKTGLTTHATTAVCTITDAAIPNVTLCEVMMRCPDGSKGVWDLMSV